MSDLLTIAKQYLERGYSVIPVKADGSKSPSITGWRKFTDRLATEDELKSWFGGGAIVGIGVVPGEASGNLVVFDFESTSNGSAYHEWLRRLTPDLLAIARSLPTVVTPSGGHHVWVRLPEAQPGGKLARLPNGKTKIEIRGEGHQVLAPGCPAECHKSGKLYEWLDAEVGSHPCPVVTLETALAFADHCSQCNEYSQPEQPRDGMPHATTRTRRPGELSPGADFNHRGSWEDTGLFSHGWTWARRQDGERGFLTRPGKSDGISASVGTVTSRESGFPYLYVWSTNCDRFAPETPYSRFAVYAILRHDGDFVEAAKELARQGYGTPEDEFKASKQESKPDKNGLDLSEFTLVDSESGDVHYPFRKPANTAAEASQANPDSPQDRGFKWSSELNAQEESVKWIWKGYLARGGVTLFSAMWKAGKTTLLAHLMKALDGSVNEFLGQPVYASRILYLSEEHESILAQRRDELLIGNHVGWASRPFRGRPTMVEWKDYLKNRIANIRKYQFDLVVIDTLSKMWPVREENDAGQVEEALMPLWDMCSEGVAVMLVHHTRKSGGEQFTASRGSGGLPAFCEILVEFGRTEDNLKNPRRTITGMGRYKDTPVKVLTELTPSGYVCLGDYDDQEVKAKHMPEEWHGQVMDMLSSGSWMSIKDIDEKLTSLRDGTSVRRNSLLEFLNLKFNGGELERKGTGVKGNPHYYRLVSIPDDWVPTPCVASGTETETESEGFAVP